jgi:hypothetical protein
VTVQVAGRVRGARTYTHVVVDERELDYDPLLS